MELNIYQWDAMKTRLSTADEQYALYNLSGEVGELHSLVAKKIRDGKIDLELVKKELGDILWCLAAVVGDFGFTLEEVARANLTKLQKRQSRGTLTGSGDNR
jgi:NTP pyrophosphatase (non-canonical NTP hydrolase)